MSLPSLVRACVLGLLMSAAVRADEYHTVTATASNDEQELTREVTVPAGKVFEVATFLALVKNYYQLQAFMMMGDRFLAVSTPFGARPADKLTCPVLVGPCQLTLQLKGSGSYPLTDGDMMILTYSLKDAVPAAGEVLTPASGNAVVIPTDATGPIQIILESSTDLVTWTAASPGTYGASTTKRFFRVRAVAQ